MRVNGTQSGASRVVWVVSICAALLIALLLIFLFQSSTIDSFPERDKTISTMQNLGAVMLSLREENHDLSAIRNIGEFLSIGDSTGIIPGGYSKLLEKDAWGTPFVWRVSRASTGDVEVALISCGQNRTFEQGEGDDIIFQLSLSGKGKGTLRYDSVTQADWPPTPMD
jgi:hypothetical protein